MAILFNLSLHFSKWKKESQRDVRPEPLLGAFWGRLLLLSLSAYLQATCRSLLQPLANREKALSPLHSS